MWVIHMCPAVGHHQDSLLYGQQCCMEMTALVCTRCYSICTKNLLLFFICDLISNSSWWCLPKYGAKETLEFSSEMASVTVTFMFNFIPLSPAKHVAKFEIAVKKFNMYS